MSYDAKIKELRRDKSLTQQQLADAIGFSRGYVATIERGAQEPSFAFAEALFSSLKVDPAWFFGVNKVTTESVDQEFVPIQRYGVSASAGGGSLVESEDGTGFYAFNRRWLTRRGLNPTALSVISVTGDSMRPELIDGDLVLLDRGQTELMDGRTFVVRFDDELFIKKLQKAPPRQLHLISVNASYPPITVDLDKDADTIQIIGRVVASMHEWI